ncbi:Protein of unknown function [Pseudoxanthomonas sp. GM95]|uniref:DUF3014 domain-containing protein n=1 Tax=Pseudoxanthomonas sp. GM95 TaxID=1881043 RepID=UPI0008D09325|nr:DUF3014 domain-containing protein [Pseudoxanthomonas sp. GM95]SEL67479.1 Protein of unknown function [Pseudoxanthomonas sp. GM95]
MQTRSSSSSIPWWSVVLVVLVIGAAGWWLFKPATQPQAPVAEVPQSPAPAAPPAEPTAPAASTPAIEHPIDAAVSADAAAPALPALADSDAPAWDALSQVVGDDGALALLLREHLIQRIVVMVDNLTQRSLTRSAMAVQPVAGNLEVADGGAGMVITPANAQRYASYVQAFTHADAKALVGAYKQFYPLFQAAYAELGKPDAYFNDRLVQVIDHLLNTPEPTQPIAVEPNGKGRLRFSDPMLESLSVGQKALVRLGPEQEAAVKAQLRAIRTALTRM